MIATSFLFIFGLFLLILGGELLVKGAAKLANHFGIPPLIIGLTIVAFGTSSPELAVSIEAGLKQESGLVLGNVLGGNICNTLLILGTCALIAPISLHTELIRIETPFVALATILIFLLALDLQITPLEGILLVGLLATYTGFLVLRSSRESGEIKEQFAQEFSESLNQSRPVLQLISILSGLAGLTVGSHFAVSAATQVASYLGVSDFLIGLTIVALGTSLPELFTSVSAIKAGERDIAIGNILGSNIFNLLMVLGVTAGLGPLTVDSEILRLDFPVATIASLICVPIFFDLQINRKEGAYMLLAYFCYMSYSITKSVAPTIAPIVGIICLLLTAPGLIVLTYQLLKHLRHRSFGSHH